MTAPVRVLVVDDSALVREVLRRGLGADPRIEVVACAGDPYQARDRILELRPDVVTLDIEMPRMDGVEFLRRLMPQHPLPVLVVSALTEEGRRVTLDAFEAGALDVVLKPRSDIARGLDAMLEELREKVVAVSTADVSHHLKARPAAARAPVVRREEPLAYRSTERVIAIGASTGGTEALRAVLPALDANTPGVVVVQHMPPGFTRMFAERLDEICAVQVKEAQTGDQVLGGRVLIAPGGMDLLVRRSGARFYVECVEADGHSVHCPSVDRLFESVALTAGANALGLVMTGMGRDGTRGLALLRHVGARTLAQDERTSVIFGMPRSAWEAGAAEALVPLERIAHHLAEYAES